ncbi:D-galactonate transporter [Alphaproteobacteria bacterium SO-S41]|nr:D-galactonate transporter [Alphaproteobacteria bacterium SO-S41]
MSVAGEARVAPAAGKAAGVGLNGSYILVALTIATTIAFLDRLLINLVVDPIRADVAISDTQFSLLQGAAFAITYTLAMLPIAWASDQFNRKYIIIASVLAWSVMTAAFGLAEGFIALLLLRAGVALGEAGLTPASVSIIRDVYPRHRQAMAVSVLTLGVYLGGAISLSVGGPALAWLQGLHDAGSLPGNLSPWRYLFIGAGAIGIAAVALLLFIREPARAPRPAGQSSASWGAFLRAFGQVRGRALAFLLACIGIHGVATAAGAWVPALFMRNHGWPPETVGLTFGIVHLAAGTLGALGGGWLVDRLTARGDEAALVRILRIGAAALAIGTTLCAILPSPMMALAANAVATVGMGVCIGLGGLGFQAMLPAQFSARGMATYVLAIGVVGGSIGPTVVPLIAGALGDGQNVGPALTLWAAAGAIWSVFWFSLILRMPAPKI